MKRLIAVVSFFCLGLGSLVGLELGKWAYSPKQAYVMFDPNRDGVTDLTIEQKNGDKITLYGLKKDSAFPYEHYVPILDLEKHYHK